MTTRILCYINSFLLLLTLAPFNISNITLTEKENVVPTSTISPPAFCDGTLGDNIFTDGDFGSGTIAVLPNDVNGYAPGYSYQPSPPPNDGFYTITNETSSWGSFANSSWVNISDNSTDPNGYMMVINASFQPGIFYENTVDNLCENTTYQFSADVINLIKPNFGLIKPNIDFLINGVVQYSTGPIPEDGDWNTYGFTFVSEPGTNSLTLTIQNNAPGGNGNDLAIDNIEFRACGPEINIDTSIPIVCDGETASLVVDIVGTQYSTPYFQWQLSTDGGITWNDLVGENDADIFLGVPVDGYEYRVIVSNSVMTIDNPKCRVISNVKPIVITPILFTHFDTICQGLELQVGTSTYTMSGIYLDSLIASHLCDSIVTTNLTIVPDLGITANFTTISPFCSDDADGSIEVNNVQNGSGIYTYSIDGEPYQPNSLFESLVEGDYSISILDHYGCEATFQIELTSPLAFEVEILDADAIILLGLELPIQAQVNLPFENITWTPTGGLSCTDCLHPIATPTTTTTYQLVATDEQGCTATDEITITVDNTRKVFFPNAFSPDADGYNDYFSIYSGLDVEEVINFQVFNRWGGLVFSNKNFQPNNDLIGWDGRVNGKKVDSGVYIYVADILFKDGLVEQFVGDVTVVE